MPGDNVLCRQRVAGQDGSPEAGPVGLALSVKIGVDGGNQDDRDTWFGPLGTVFIEVD